MRVTAKVIRSGNWWAIEVPEVPGVYSQAKRLNEVAEMAADAVSGALEIDPASVKVDLDVNSEEVQELRAAREEVESAQTTMTIASRNLDAVITRMRDSGYTVREMASVLEVSPQRVQQLVNRANKNQAPELKAG